MCISDKNAFENVIHINYNTNLDEIKNQIISNSTKFNNIKSLYDKLLKRITYLINIYNKDKHKEYQSTPESSDNDSNSNDTSCDSNNTSSDSYYDN